MATSRVSDLMKEGMKLVQEKRSAEAYQVFRDVTAQDPGNEFGWIWLSITTENRAEKRAALEKALQLNPSSQHAREAMKALEAEDRNQAVTAGTAYGATSPGLRMSPEPRLDPSLDRGDPLRAALGSSSTQEKGSKTKKVKQPKPVKASKRDQTMVSQQPRNRAVASRIRLGVLFALAIIVTLLVVYFVLQQLQKNQENAPVATSETTAAATTAAGTNTTPGAATTIAGGTPNAATTGAAVATTAGTAGATTAATGAATTGAVSSTAAATTGATTSAATTATTAVSGTTNQPPPAGAADTAAIAKALQTARDSQAAGDYKAAIGAYQEALKVDSRNVAANLGLGSSYLTAPTSALPPGADRYAEAVRSFNIVTAQAPNWPGGYARLGEALAGQGNVKAAIAAFAKSLELDPNGPERWLYLAALYDRDNQPEQARFAREKANSQGAAPTPTPVPPATPAPAPPAPTPTKK